MAEPSTPPALARLRRGVRHSHNWVQLLRFGVVGASGYVVNLTVFAICVEVLDLGYRAGAVLAFLVAVANNFAWNRKWTFSEADNHVRQQAVRFLATSLVAFLGALMVLELLVSGGVSPLPAQAVSIVCATPLNFIANKIWTFSASLPAADRTP